MKLLRFTLVCSLLLLAASPSFALACKSCIGLEYPYCEPTPGSGTRCIIGQDTCQDGKAPLCNPFTEESAPAMLAEWTVTSIEVSRPAQETEIVTFSAVVADAGRLSPSTLQK